MNKRRRYQRKRLVSETRWIRRTGDKFMAAFSVGLDVFEAEQWIRSDKRLSVWRRESSARWARRVQRGSR
jgi:hypothetical protein